jgi:hypothetical protein
MGQAHGYRELDDAMTMATSMQGIPFDANGSALFLAKLCKSPPLRSRSVRRGHCSQSDGATCNSQDMLVMAQAMEEACSFLIGVCIVSAAKRRQIAMTVIHYANTGMRDPHRLAVKAIVKAG